MFGNDFLSRGEDLREEASIGELQQRAEVDIGERRSATEDGGDV